MESGVADTSSGYFFADWAGVLPPAMAQLFSVFPTFVYNEMVTLVNAGLADMGVSARMSLLSMQ
jgi:hypothetical protein